MTNGGKGRGWSVLLAEDNDDHALLIRMAIERAAEGPVEVRRARDGDQAIELIEEEVPDLLLLDLKMPGRSGHEVLEHVKGSERLRKVPVAVLTSSDRDEDVARSYGLGGNHFITKPENPAELEDRLRSLFKNLSELSSIRRGSAGLTATARSASGPAASTLRTVFGWGLFLLILAALVVYAFASGVLG